MTKNGLLLVISVLLSVMISSATSISSAARSPAAEPLGIRDIYGVAVQGDRAYLAGYNGLAVVDLTDETQPRIVKELPRPVLNRWVDVDRDVLYVEAGDGLHVFRLGECNAVEEVGRLPMELTWAVARVGQWVYIIGRQSVFPTTQLLAVDLANPAAPRLRGSYPLRSMSASGLAISDDMLVLFGGRDVQLMEVRNGYRFVDLGRRQLPESGVRDIALHGRRLYVATDRSLRVFDLTPEGLREAGGCVDCFRGTVTYLEVAEDLLLVSGDGLRTKDKGELLIFSLTNLRQPVHVLTLDQPTNANFPLRAEIVGHRVYLGEGWPPRRGIDAFFGLPPVTNAGLRVIDVADPRAPHQLAYLSTGGSFINNFGRR